MGIKSLDELRQLREQHKNKVGLRSGAAGENSEHAEILVGLATCGIAAGARETMNAFLAGLSSRGIQNIKVIPVGCIGFCKAEPIVQVNLPGGTPVVYGNVTKDRVDGIIESHIVNKTPVAELIIDAKIGV